MGLLGWSLTFLIVAIIAGLLGFWVIAGVTATIAKWLFIIFAVLFVITIISHLVSGPKPRMRNSMSMKPRKVEYY